LGNRGGHLRGAERRKEKKAGRQADMGEDSIMKKGTKGGEGIRYHDALASRILVDETMVWCGELCT